MLTPSLPGASIAAGPQDWQILQQDAQGRAAVALAGVYRTEATEFRVEARLVREADGSPVTAALDWRPAALLPDQRWEMTLSGIPAGGLYRLETRVWRDHCPDTRPMRGDYVHHLGVGDLWLIAGQSNASGTGIGYVEDPPMLGVHQLGNDEQWKLAAHPLEDATRSRHTVTVHGVFQGHSAWIAFARRLRSELNYPIGLIPAALGGAPLSYYAPGHALYNNMLEMVRLAGGRVRGMVWYQGESDTVTPARDTYLQHFRTFVQDARRDLGAADLPILTAQLGRFGAPVPHADRGLTLIREAQRRAALEIPGVALIPTLDLPLSDDVHISAPGNLVLGARFAVSALRHVYGRDLDEPGIALRAAEFIQDEPPTLRLTFAPLSAGWCPVGPIEDFAARDEGGALGIAQVTPDDRGWVDLRLARPPVGPVTLDCLPGCYPRPSLRDRDQRPLLAFSVRVG